MNNLSIKLQVELLRALQKTIQKWEKGEYAEMLEEDERDTIILNTLLDAIYNFFIECTPESQCPICLIKGLGDRLFMPSTTVGVTEDGMSLEKIDSHIEGIAEGIADIIKEIEELLDDED